MGTVRQLIKHSALKIGEQFERMHGGHSIVGFAPESICITLRKPLGIGDLIMMAPFVAAVASLPHGLPVVLLTEHSALFDIPGVSWLQPGLQTRKRLRRALLVSPTQSWRHAMPRMYAGWAVGYFLSERLSCNFAGVRSRYDARIGHYCDRTVPILKILEGVWPVSSNPLSIPSYPALRNDSVDGFGLPPEYCSLAPFSNWPERQYPPEYWKKVIDGVRRRLPVVLVGGSHPDERAMACSLAVEGVINLVGRTSLGQLASVLAGSRLYLGNDSGPSHMAFLSAQASVVVFGCVGGKQRIPLDPGLSSRIRVLGNGSACPHFPCYDGFTKPECRNPEPCLCLTSVSPDAVLEEAFSILRGER